MWSSLVAAVGLVASVVATPGAPVTAAGVEAARTPSPSALVGQRIMIAMTGTAPAPELLREVGAGVVGGVVLYGANVRSAGQLRNLTGRLQAAARRGGRPRLLIAVDQEGGLVKRLQFAGPTLSQPVIGARGAATAEAQGRLTARGLRAAGINLDIAPLADVPRRRSAFIWREHRAYSFASRRVAAAATGFAAGLGRGGVAATFKHFPGLGRALTDTDRVPAIIHGSRASFAPDLRPYRTAFARGLPPVVMLATARYPAWDGARPVPWSPRIVGGLLRRELGFRGVTMTDSLNAASAANLRPPLSAGLATARAGTDVVLFSDPAAGRAVHRVLLAAALDGRLSRRNLLASYTRILALKRHLAR
jgi:beta-N-acetylhexosaminidase